MTIALITHPECLLHDTGSGHPECPDRLRVITDELALSSLVPSLQYEIAPQATLEQLLRVHDEAYINTLIQMVPSQGLTRIDPDTVMSPHTLSAAFHAAGAVVRGVDLVLSNQQINAAFCNVRPPGHHAERAQAMGFCFFNNIAVGVAHALEHHHLKRVAIVDFDVHRGNGTEDMFQNNKKVLICSMYEQFLYPAHEIQVNAKNIIYIPLDAGSTGREFRAELSLHALEKINEFRPEIIFISAGFDGHVCDNISSLNLTEADYLWISRQIKRIADIHCPGRIVSTLEGGYALEVLGKCVISHLQGLLD